MEKVVFLVIVALLGMAHAASHFAVEDQMIGDLHTKVLKNTKTDEYVQIITDLGGRVEDLVLMHKRHKKLRSVLLTHNKNATEIKENAWWKNAILLPYANRINGVSFLALHNFVLATPSQTLVSGHPPAWKTGNPAIINIIGA